MANAQWQFYDTHPAAHAEQLMGTITASMVISAEQIL